MKNLIILMILLAALKMCGISYPEIDNIILSGGENGFIMEAFSSSEELGPEEIELVPGEIELSEGEEAFFD